MNVLENVKRGFVINPDFDQSLLETKSLNEMIYPIKAGEKPKAKYASKWRMIPNVKYIIDLENGNLKRYDLSSQTNTKTALDPTFYKQILKDGTVTTPLYNFDDITATDAVITDVGT